MRKKLNFISFVEMLKKYIQVRRTARFFLSKEPDEQIKTVLVVLHGYAQNGDDFLEAFGELKRDDLLILAPEGLSKFYWKDFTSDPSSSWMTSLERENEILDTMRYLEQVVLDIKAQLPCRNVEFVCLGFSQGAATASRLVCNPYLSFTKLLLYGGAPAHDLHWQVLLEVLEFHLIYGDNDALVSESQVTKVKKLIESKRFPVRVHPYKGKHKIEAAGLQIVAQILDE